MASENKLTLTEILDDFFTLLPPDMEKSLKIIEQIKNDSDLLLASFELIEQLEDSQMQKQFFQLFSFAFKQALIAEEYLEIFANFFPSLVWCHYQKSLSIKFPWFNEESSCGNLVEEILVEIYNNIKIHQTVKQHSSYVLPIEPYPIFQNDIDEIYKAFKIPLDLPLNNIEQIFTTNYQELVLNSSSMDVGTYSNSFSQIPYPLSNFIYSKRMLMYSFYITFFHAHIDSMELVSLKRLTKLTSLICRVGYSESKFFPHDNCNLTKTDILKLENCSMPRAQMTNHFVRKLSAILLHLLYKIPYEVIACISDLKTVCEIRLLCAAQLSVESLLMYVNSIENAFLKYSQYSFTLSFTDVNK